VPDAQIQERVRAMMANQAGPDFVIGDEALAARLQQLQFTPSSSDCRERCG
jgi:hypothetical protein